MANVQPERTDYRDSTNGDSSAVDPRKTASIAFANRRTTPEAVTIEDASGAKTVLRSPDVRQAGFTAEIDRSLNLGREPVIVLDGPEHRRYRAATARFFTPKTVTTRYLKLMEETAERLIADFRKSGSADIGLMAMEMATAIAADIVGLTESEPRALAHRLLRLIGGGKDRRDTKIQNLLANIKTLYRFKKFEYLDVRPAVNVRRKERHQDVISHLLDEDYPLLGILAECLTYGGAGMVTTKEFIVVAFWHMMDNRPVRDRFMAGDRREQVLLLEEILRLEPIIGTLKRRANDEIEMPDGTRVPAGTLFQIDVREANIDKDAVGGEPLQIDPDRPIAQRTGGSLFAFGDGVHRCPGHQVAMYESAVFLEALFKVPDLQIVRQPDLGWDQMIEGYEIYGMEISCQVC